MLAALNHPNIAGIYDLAEPKERLLLVLEFVPGETLAERLARAPLPFREVLLISAGRSLKELKPPTRAALSTAT